MERLAYFSLRRLSGQVFWAFMLLAALMLATGIGAYYLLSQADTANKNQYDLNRQADSARLLNQAVSNQLNSLSVVQLYNLPTGLQYLQTTQSQLANGINQARPFFGPTAPDAATFQQLETLYRSFSTDLSNSTSQSDAANRRFYDLLHSDLDHLSAQATALQRDCEKAAREATQQYSSLVATIRQIYLAGAFGLFGLGVLFAALVARWLGLPLLRLARGLRRIASGDLSQQLEISGAEEVAGLAVSFNRAMANLTLAIVRIQEQAAAITRITERVINSSQQQADSLSEQAIAIAGVSATVAELTTTGRQIAESARMVAERVEEASLRADQGHETMQTTMNTMSDMHKRIDLIYDRVQELNTVAQHIRQVALLIDTLSTDTHLLALNASIESVGNEAENERFAAVASQVRQLSMRSRVGAVEIQDLVSKTQEDALRCVRTTEVGRKAVSRGEELVETSLDSIDTIRGQVSQTAQLSQAISQATEQQREASGQVATSLRSLTEFINMLSANSQQFQLSANALGEVVDQLNTVINSFSVQPADPEAEDSADTSPAPVAQELIQERTRPEALPLEPLSSL